MRTPTRWLAPVAMAVSLALILLTGACAQSAGPDMESALIGVETSQLFITVRNQSGQSLSNVHVAIVPVGGATEFTHTLSRMESGEKRDLSLSQFIGRDGTPFNLRVVRPRTVKVSGTSFDGRAIQVETRWR